MLNGSICVSRRDNLKSLDKVEKSIAAPVNRFDLEDEQRGRG